MSINPKKILAKNKGAAMIIVVLFFVVIGSIILIGIIAPTVREYLLVRDSLQSKKSYFLAESGVEDILYRIKNGITKDNFEELLLDGTQAETSITDITSDKKEIVSIGKTNGIERSVKIKANTGIGVSFSYGVLSGVGGFTMENNSKIIGSVYSNGYIKGSGEITGTATSANLSALVSDQSNGEGTPDYDVKIGTTNSTQDFTQRFQVSNVGVVTKVRLYLKKVGTPANITVRITNTSGDGTDQAPYWESLTSATLPASSVSTNYGWIDVPFSKYVQLVPGVNYWLVLDTTTTGSSKYYVLGANANGYLNGYGKIGEFQGVWSKSAVDGKDLFFNLFMGGSTGLISGVKVGTESMGNAYAHEVNNSTISGTNHCQVGSGNNKPCNTSLADPVQIAMPISEQNILDWKEQAEAGGTINGTYIIPASMSLGPKKIHGDLYLENNKTLTLTGPLWVEGSFVAAHNSFVKLDPSFGDSSGVIIADNLIQIYNNAVFQGSGTAGSYILVLSTSPQDEAIQLANNAGAVALYAANGKITIYNNGGAKSVNGYAIHLMNNAVLQYDSGLSDLNFKSGPSGSWNIESWQEVE